MAAATWWVLGAAVAAVSAAAIQLALRQPEHGRLLWIGCLLVCGVAMWHDTATRRIPNRLTYPAILIGLLFNALLPPLFEVAGLAEANLFLGATGPRDGFLGFGLCAIIGLVSFLVRGLGGGDVKLLGVLGAMLGLGGVLPVLFNTLIVAAVVGLGNWAIRGTLVARLRVVAQRSLAAVMTRDLGTELYPFARSEAPFGLAVFLGLALSPFVELHRFLGLT